MMELKVDGNPGQGNTFQDIDIQSPGVYAPNASEIYYGLPSRMAADFENLRKDILKEVTQETIEELKYYITELPGKKPFE